ncbi:MFS transporter [Streptomyces sp. ms191]|nr:MFS transporter [Streptomyces sp. ms191]
MERTLRNARVATFVYFALNGFLLGMWVVHIPAVAHAVGIGHAALGWLLLLLGLGAFAGMQLAGPLTDRLGARTVVPLGAALCSAAVVLPGLAVDTWTLGAALLLLGFGNGCLDVSMNAHAVQVESGYGRPVMSAFHATFSLGGVLAALIGARTLSGGLPPAATLAAAAVLGLVVAGVTARALLPAAARAATAPDAGTAEPWRRIATAHQPRHRTHHVLTVVQQQQQPPRPAMLHQPVQRIVALPVEGRGAPELRLAGAECGQDGGGDVRLPPDGGEFGDPDRSFGAVRALQGEPGLADPAGPGQGDETPGPQRRPERVQFGRPADEGGQPRGEDGALRRLLAGQQLGVEGAQVRAGVRAEAVREETADLLVRLERLRAAAGRPQRADPQGLQRLVERVLGRHGRQGRERGPGAAEGHVRGEPVPARLRVPLLRADDQGVAGTAREVGERGPVPQPEGLVQDPGRPGRVPVGQGPGPVRGQLLEHVQVDVLRGRGEPVPAAGGGQDGVPAEGLAQPPDQRLQRRRALRVPRRHALPDPGDERPGAHVPPAGGGQHRQQGPQPGTAERGLAAVVPDRPAGTEDSVARIHRPILPGR